MIRVCVRCARRCIRAMQTSLVWLRDALRAVFDRHPRVCFTNWYGKMTPQSLGSFFMKPYLPESFGEFRLSCYRPQLEFFSVEGPLRAVQKSKAAVKVFYTGEDVVRNFTGYSHECTGCCDVSVGFSLDRTEENYARLPLWCHTYFDTFDKDEILRRIRALNALRMKKDKFCALIAHHDRPVGDNTSGGGIRSQILDLLSPVARIDCPGTFRHNDDSLWQDCADDKPTYLRRYMFNICPENVSVRGYVTEKLFEAFRSACIPIYNGSENKPEEGLVNPDALILYAPERADAVLAEVRQLWNSESYYNEFISRPRLLEDGVDYIYNMNKTLQEKLEAVFAAKLGYARG